MLKKNEVAQQTKAMIGKLLESKKVSCDVEYVLKALHDNSLFTKDEFNEITNILQQKKE
jgi:hypothetical protein